SNTLTVTFEPRPEVVTFDATPIGVCGAGVVVRTWTTGNATGAYLEHRTASNGSMRDVTTAYGATGVRPGPGDELALPARPSYGAGCSTLTIGGGQRPSIGFDVTPATRVAGQEATITWDVQGAKSVQLNGQPVAANGTLTDASHHTVTYRLEVEAEDCD